MNHSRYLSKHSKIKISLMKLKNKVLKSNDVRYKLRKIIKMIGSIRRTEYHIKKALKNHFVKIREI